MMSNQYVELPLPDVGGLLSEGAAWSARARE